MSLKNPVQQKLCKCIGCNDLANANAIYDYCSFCYYNCEIGEPCQKDEKPDSCELDEVLTWKCRICNYSLRLRRTTSDDREISIYCRLCHRNQVYSTIYRGDTDATELLKAIDQCDDCPSKPMKCSDLCDLHCYEMEKISDTRLIPIGDSFFEKEFLKPS